MIERRADRVAPLCRRPGGRGPSQVRVFQLGARGAAATPAGTIPTLPVSTVWNVAKLEGDEVLFQNESYTVPSAFYRYKPQGKHAAQGSTDVTPTALAVKSKADFSDAVVRERNVFLKDGTQVPMSILRKRGTKLDGSSPVLLSGYGG